MNIHSSTYRNRTSRTENSRLVDSSQPTAAKSTEGSGDWKDTLAAFGDVLEMRENLGLSDAVHGREASEIMERYLADESPTEDLKVIADRVMAKEGMIPELTPEVLKAAQAVTGAPKPDHDCVEDLRHLAMVSVDNGDLNPKTGKLENQSKDIDQCEYAEMMPNGNIKMMVAIADVDAAVKKGDIIDRQATHQGATVYTDDKIFPMIPRRLSEDFTSLDEKVDRLAVVKEFQVTPEGHVIEPRVFRGYIRNRAQMAYDSVNEWLTDGSGPKPPQLEDPALAEQIKLQDEAAQRLRTYFHSRGSLELESGETRAQMSDGKVTGMKKEEQTRAKDKVKFNMIAANMTSMRVLEESGMPTLRRIVKTPEKWDRIKELAGKFNYELPSDPSAPALNAFLESRKAAAPEQHEELSSQVIRLVGRGEYVVATPNEPIEGHFALAVPDYGHTTAPNRRGPDLVNQRIEKAVAQGDECPYTPEELEELAGHFNQQQRSIQKVEQRVHRSATAKLMKSRVGESFDGRYHKELRNGTLVRLKEPYVTGMVKRKLEGEPGDELRVTLTGVDVAKGHVDFKVAQEQSVEGFLLKV